MPPALLLASVYTLIAPPDHRIPHLRVGDNMLSNAVGVSRPTVWVVAALALAGARPAGAGVAVYDRDDVKLEIGIRLQPRVELENRGADWTRDFLVRRSRLKLTGKYHAAAFNFEWRLDRTDQIGQAVSIGLENGYIQYPLGAGVEVRAGLYDQPYSRDRLTSDSKQLVVDRGAVSNVPDALGLADNAIGAQLMGSVRGGHVQWAGGVFDNRLIAGELQDLPMLVGRVDFNFGSVKDIFRDAHFGDDSWYSLGINGSWQGEIENTAGDHEGTNGAAGVDGMLDVPLGPGRAFARSEFNVVESQPPAGGNSTDTRVWMAACGYLVADRLQPTLRFDQVHRDVAEGGGTQNITYVGANYYRNGHDSKFQADVRFESGTGEAVDGVRLQAQLDF